ncbi:hypothetical protein [Deinococcus cellulosilyticus]|uniref:Uncharacterized protein n=1 Tax=Deinococcus cellulosilyticus (strain DSM 18568 / NBRC 106333 / KACC 11606 / 5516J-15) TaxID=1223518 RepID=A0A511N7X9_DEIC1|nr:hypothetical protein [Deinococcus cellulosilyticus]GEM48934.1 hypothetical protein DC3_45690 [Deinococcus cellulosilyticus NBRC 106333 = KACC 11606]
MNILSSIKILIQPAVLALALFWTLPPVFLWLTNVVEGIFGLPPMDIHLIQQDLPLWLYLPSTLVVWATVCRVYRGQSEPGD